MYYKHKKTNQLVDLIYSDNLLCVIIELENDLESYDLSKGKVFNGNKRDFKNHFQKANQKDLEKANIILPPKRLVDDVKTQILESKGFIKEVFCGF